MEDVNLKSALDPEYLAQLKIANEMVSRYLRNNPPYDINDLFRIALNTFKSSEELLSRGLRRRIISGI